MQREFNDKVNFNTRMGQDKLGLCDWESWLNQENSVFISNQHLIFLKSGERVGLFTVYPMLSL